MPGHIALSTSKSADDGTAMGEFGVSGKDMPSLYFLTSKMVQRFRPAVHRTNKSKLVRMFGHAREDFGDLDTANPGIDRTEGASNFGNRIRLHVPRIKLARAADE